MVERRKDSKGRVLKENESERKQGGYQYRLRSSDGKRHTVYAPTLNELREKEASIQRDKSDGIRTSTKKITINDVYDMWILLKKGLKNNTFVNYKYVYEQFVRNELGKLKIVKLHKSGVRRFYNYLFDKRELKVTTINIVHTVLHQVLDMAVEDDYLRSNPSNNALKEIKKARNLYTEKRKALTVAEQELFLTFLINSELYSRWYTIFATMLGTGLRVGEALGLRWEDINFKERTISVNHTLIYYNKTGKRNGFSFAVNTPKTKAGKRTIPMVESVYKALLLEKNNQELSGITSKAIVDGYQNFIFVNKIGNVQSLYTLNSMIRNIVRDCNKEVLDKAKGKCKENIVLLPKFSCHTLRHTFTTRLCEANVNIKVIQDVLGHADVSTTLDIYADVTKDLTKKEFEAFEDFIKTEKYAS